MKWEISLPTKDYKDLIKKLAQNAEKAFCNSYVRNHIVEQGWYKITVTEEPGYDHESKEYVPNGKITLRVETTDKVPV